MNSTKKFHFSTPILIIITIVSLLGLIASLAIQYFQSSTLLRQVDSFKSEVVFQRNQKEEVRKIWENQAVQNDKLVIAQENFSSQVEEYLTEMKRTYRFINGNPEFLPTASEARIKERIDQLELEKKNLDEQSVKNTELKNQNKESIDTLYLKADQDQSNRANPDGIRE
jgi:hypothetical protein